MNLVALIVRNIFHYARNNLALFAGIVVCTGIVVGALAVGDSMRYSLERIAMERLGKIDTVVQRENGFFRQELANDIAEGLALESAAVMLLKGSALNQERDFPVNDVQVIGIKGDFAKFAHMEIPALGEDEVFVNERLAKSIGYETGDSFLLKLFSFDPMPAEAPFSDKARSTVSIRVRIRGILQEGALGNFNLARSQVEPKNVFVSLDRLSGLMGLHGMANAVLVSNRGMPEKPETAIDKRLASCITLDDIGYSLRVNQERDFIELVSDRIFIEPDMEKAVTDAFPEAEGICTYFIDTFSSGNRKSHYAFAAGIPDGYAPGTRLGRGEMIASEWLATELALSAGDEVSISFPVPDDEKGTSVHTETFSVTRVYGTDEKLSDSSLMPEFPGFTDVENCSDFDPGTAIDLKNITVRDEKYWDEYGGTPKAFVSIDSAREMWGNRYGNLTSVRWFSRETSANEIAEGILQRIDPADFGFRVTPAKQEAMAASREGIDFGELLLSLSIFIVLSALILVALFLSFNLETRQKDIGILKAIGLGRKRIIAALMAETSAIIVAGSIVGALFGIAYDCAVLFMLRTFWTGAVASASVYFRVTAQSLFLGTCAGALLGFAVSIAIVISYVRRQAADTIGRKTRIRNKPMIANAFFSFVACAASLCALYVALTGGGEQSLFFSLSGFCLLAFFVSIAGLFLSAFSKSRVNGITSIAGLGLRNAGAKKARSLGVIGVIACSIFIIMSVGMNRNYDIESGTGGFTLFVKTSVPVLEDIDSEKASYLAGLEGEIMKETRFVRLREKVFEDASCLNLNKVKQPSVLGINPSDFSGKTSFTFASVSGGIDPRNPWSALANPDADGSIPGIIDDTVMRWSLGMAIGDYIEYENEKGDAFRVRIIGTLDNSIFQGNVLVAESAFKEQFPSTGGYTIVLADNPDGADTGMIRSTLLTTMSSFVPDIVSAAERLLMFYRVEDTYLSIFFILGGLGIALGTLGLGSLIAKNLRENSTSLAVLKAVGYTRKNVVSVISAEYVFLLVCGILAGGLSSAISLVPMLDTGGLGSIFASSASIVLIVFATGLFAIGVAVKRSTKTEPAEILKAE